MKRLAGRIGAHVGLPGHALVVADATEPYEGTLKRFIRRALFLGGRYYVLADELLKDSSDPFRWLLHFEGELTREDKDFFIRNGDSGLLLKFISPRSIIHRLEQGFKATHDDETLIKSVEEKRAELLRAEYLSVSAKKDSTEQLFLSVLYPLSAKERLPEVSHLESDAWTAFTLSRDTSVDTVGVRRSESASPFRGDGLETDALLFAISRDAKSAMSGALFENATRFAISGEMSFRSASPCTAALKVGDGIELAIESKETTTLEVHCPFTPKTALLDGAAFSKYRYDAAAGVAELEVQDGRHAVSLR